jgi:hypothetical protein
MEQIDLFRFVNSAKLCFSSPRRRTLQESIALPEIDEPGTLPEFFLFEEQSIRNLVDVMSDPNDESS